MADTFGFEPRTFNVGSPYGGYGGGSGCDASTWSMLLMLLSRQGLNYDDGGKCFRGKDGCIVDALQVQSVINKLDLSAEALSNAKSALADRICDAKDKIDATLDRAKDLNIAEFRATQKDLGEIKSEASKNLFLLAKEGSENTQKILNAIASSEKSVVGSIEGNEKSRLLERIHSLERAADHSHFDHKSRDVEFSVIQNQNQAQAQAQTQTIEKANWDRLFSRIDQSIDQKFANKTVQFGHGNVAIPTNASNATNVH